MKVEDVVEGWKKGELSGDAAMIVIYNILYPPVITQEEIDWAKDELQKKRDKESEFHFTVAKE
jgi:hypothetical protein